MTPKIKATLNRAAGILEGLSASGDLSTTMTDMLIAVVEMIDAVLRDDERCQLARKD